MIEHIQTLQSLAQSGFAYTKDPYDRQRFDTIKQICARLLQEVAGLPQAQEESLIFDEEGYRTPKAIGMDPNNTTRLIDCSFFAS